MYNMDLSIGSYKFRLEILILIVIVSWILFGHLLCSCCTISFKEGLAMAKNAATTSSGSSSITSSNTSSNTNSNTSSSSDSLLEGFVGANNTAYGPQFSGAKSPDYITKPSSWGIPNLIYSPGTTPDAGVKAIWNRPKQPIPLPKGEMLMFATTQFKPECCPNAFTSSTGCACMTTEQYGYLLERGGNNVPYSVY
jgi:hypothetical protein